MFMFDIFGKKKYFFYRPTNQNEKKQEPIQWMCVCVIVVVHPLNDFFLLLLLKWHFFDVN